MATDLRSLLDADPQYSVVRKARERAAAGAVAKPVAAAAKKKGGGGGGGHAIMVGPSGVGDVESTLAQRGKEESAALDEALMRKQGQDAGNRQFAAQFSAQQAGERAQGLKRQAAFGTDNPLLAAKIAATGVTSPDFKRLAADDPEGAAAALHHARVLLGREALRTDEPGIADPAQVRESAVAQRDRARAAGSSDQSAQAADVLFGGKLAGAEQAVAAGRETARAGEEATAAMDLKAEEKAQVQHNMHRATADLLGTLHDSGFESARQRWLQMHTDGTAEALGLSLRHMSEIGKTLRFAASAAPSTVLNPGGVDVPAAAEQRRLDAQQQHQQAITDMTPKKPLPSTTDYAAGDVPPPEKTEQPEPPPEDDLGVSVFGPRS